MRKEPSHFPVKRSNFMPITMIYRGGRVDGCFGTLGQDNSVKFIQTTSTHLLVANRILESRPWKVESRRLERCSGWLEYPH